MAKTKRLRYCRNGVIGSQRKLEQKKKLDVTNEHRKPGRWKLKQNRIFDPCKRKHTRVKYEKPQGRKTRKKNKIKPPRSYKHLIVPWLNSKSHSFESELQSFCDYVRLTKNEILTRKLILNTVKEICKTFNASVETYGSYSSLEGTFERPR